jgi:hypothetical protein
MKSSALAVILNLPTWFWVSLAAASTWPFCSWVRVRKARGIVRLPVVVGVPVAGSDKMEVSSPVAGGTVLRAWLPLPPEPPRLPLQPGA